MDFGADGATGPEAFVGEEGASDAQPLTLAEMEAAALKEEGGDDQGGAEPEKEVAAEPDPAKPVVEDHGKLVEQVANLKKAHDTSRAESRIARQEAETARREAADLKALVAKLQGGEQAAAPDPQLDPLGYLKHLQTQEAARQKAADEQQQQDAKAGEHRAFLETVTSQEAEFAAETPDYYAATNFLRESRVAELVEFGMTPEAAQAHYGREVFEQLQAMKQQGLNPAKVAYKLAKDRGYAKADPAKDAAAIAAEAAKKLETIEAGAGAAKTLTANGGGKGAPEGGSIESKIANLSGAALKDAWRRHKAQMNG